MALPERLFIANRGEIALRIARTARDLGVGVITAYSADEAAAGHIGIGAQSVGLPGSGPAGYLDVAAIVDAAVDAYADALHPGYGLLSERAALADACANQGVTFVGPDAETLELFGDKVRSRQLARHIGVPVLPGTDDECTAAEAGELLDELKGRRGSDAGLMIKALGGGGGRGIRLVRNGDEIAEAIERARSEGAGSGDNAVFAELLVERARHIEVQIVGDAAGSVIHLGDRECSVQRRHQKLIEIAPALPLPERLRAAMWDHAVAIGSAARLCGVATVEFLVDTSRPLTEHSEAWFIEVNPRLQVEHTVTEEITGLDIVETQLRLAGGATLADMGLTQAEIAFRGAAVQCRVNAETIDENGHPTPSSGQIDRWVPPTGPGVRVDTAAHDGMTINPRFDSLLAKVIVRSPSGLIGDAARRASRALSELVTEPVATNAPLLRAVLEHDDFVAAQVSTRWFEDHAAELAEAAAILTDPGDEPPTAAQAESHAGPGVGVTPADTTISDGAVAAPLTGVVVSVEVATGDEVGRGQSIVIIEAMKMEHVVVAPSAGVIESILVTAGELVSEGAPLVVVDAADVDTDDARPEDEIDLELVRDDLAAVHERHRITGDDARPDAVAKRRATGQRTARENLADLIDPESFIEYGALMIAAQRKRRTEADLIERTPADGMVGGIGSVNGEQFPGRESRCVVMSYDYTVLAGTQGHQNHRKKDRLFEIAADQRLPVVLFAEGGGGRPGDTDGIQVAGLDCLAFNLFGKLSGLVPLVGIVSGRCFAGNAALLGCCDVVIATEGTNIGMGGPAMVEGGGLGSFTPEDIGPLTIQSANGVVDIAVADEAEAVAVARRYLSYFQGPVTDGEVADQRLLRHAVPENRLRVYEVRSVIDTLCDVGSVLELRAGFGPGMVTALARIDGRPVGVIANDPRHLGGAIDSDAADKAARFLQLCDAHDLPVVSLCDTPGIMVGPEAETAATVRHASRLFVIGSNIDVPLVTVVLRKGYGLGAQAMAGGSFKAPLFTVGWPTSEFGGMGLEGAVQLGYRRELEAVDDLEERQALYEEKVAQMYKVGQGLNYATAFEIDDVIDPADTRHWIKTALAAAAPVAPRTGKKRPWVDTW